MKATGVLYPGRIVSARDGGAWSAIAGRCVLFENVTLSGEE